MIKNIFLLLTLSLSTLSNVNVNRSQNLIKKSSISIADTQYFFDADESQINEYYKDIDLNLKGDKFLDSLQLTLTKNHKKISNNESKRSDWKLFCISDRDLEKSPLTKTEIENKQIMLFDKVYVRCLYESDPFFFERSTQPGSKYLDREHVFPKSYGFSDPIKGSYDFLPYAATDMHNLHTGEKKNNQNGHNNYPFGNVKNKNATSTKKIYSKISNKVTGYLGIGKNGETVYEPLDRDKGDIARTIFYMGARYHTFDTNKNHPNSPSLRISDNPSKIYGNNKKSLTAEDTIDSPAHYGMLSDLLEWHKNDKVDDHEIHRNNIVFKFIQHNRNPFIDHPDWVDKAFSSEDPGNNETNPEDPGNNETNPENPGNNQNEPEQQSNKNFLITNYQLLIIIIVSGAVIVLIIAIILVSVSSSKKKKKRKKK